MSDVGAPSGGAFGMVDDSPRLDSGITLLCGSSFVRCRPSGEIRPGGLDGYYAADTRMLDRLELRVDGGDFVPERTTAGGSGTEHLAVGTVGSPVAPHLLVSVRLALGDDLRVEVTLENLTTEHREVRLEVVVGSDFADIFQVKRSERPQDGFVGAGAYEGGLLLAYQNGGFRRAVRVCCDHEAAIGRAGLTAVVAVGGRDRRSVVVTATPEVQHHQPVMGPRPARTSPLLPLARDRAAEDPATGAVWRRSVDDLGLLLMTDPDTDARTIIAAGAPWFLALFGRDSLITAWATLPETRALAVSVLDALADRQGTQVDPVTSEEPGRILHELRTGERVRRGDGWGTTYYGSVDATPLFVMVLDATQRAGLDEAVLRRLLPAAEAAVAWVLRTVERDPNRLLTYPRAERAPGAAALTLVNQGWKDSDDAVVHLDGRLAEGPVALVEVQGYAVAALEGMARLRTVSDTGDPAPLRAAADELAGQLEDRFWMPEEGTYALAVDGSGRPVRSVTSNPGHLLWAGVVPPAHVAPLAERLLADDVFTGFGLRTLSADHPGFNPVSYHRGSVWPHDTALCAAGLAAAGQTGPARRLAAGLVDAADPTGRLPELFAGFARTRFDPPLPYPTSCAPQAWAAAAGVVACRILSVTGGGARDGGGHGGDAQGATGELG